MVRICGVIWLPREGSNQSYNTPCPSPQIHQLFLEYGNKKQSVYPFTPHSQCTSNHERGLMNQVIQASYYRWRYAPRERGKGTFPRFLGPSATSSWWNAGPLSFWLSPGLTKYTIARALYSNSRIVFLAMFWMHAGISSTIGQTQLFLVIVIPWRLLLF